MSDNEHPLNKIEDIKRHLYDREDTVTNRPREGTLHPIAHHVPDTWQKEVKEEINIKDNFKKPPMSPFKKFFMGAFVFFVAALGFAYYMFSNERVSVSNEKIEITVIGNAFTKGGEELPLQIEIRNNNNANLELADLLIEYPKGASDSPTDVVRMPRDTVGTIESGGTVIRNIKVKLFGDEKSARNIKITLEYHPQGSNAIFTKVKEYPVTISTSPLSLTIEGPDQTASDQLITFKVRASLNTSLPEGESVIQVSYPNNFIFESATPMPSLGKNIWSMGSLTQEEPLNIEIKGRLLGEDNDEQIFHVYAGTTSPSNQSVVNVVYNSLLKSVLITKPFLEARILVNGQDLPSYTANGGSNVSGQIYWMNNLPNRITDAEVILKLSGNVLDKEQVETLDGYYDSTNSQIVWNKNTSEDLGSIEPGASGYLSFNFKPVSLVGASSIKDPQVVLDVSIKGRQPSEGFTYNEVNNFINKTVKISSDFQIASSASFLSGSLPPKAETETRYTVTWTLSNSSNNVTGAQAKAILPIYVKWAGKTAGSNENISYNESTREVIWNIGSVRANTGFDAMNREASFVLSLTPSLSQVGAVPQLMKEVSLSGTDSFTGTVVKSTRGPITTSLRNDPSFAPGNERVIK